MTLFILHFFFFFVRVRIRVRIRVKVRVCTVKPLLSGHLWDLVQVSA